MENRQLNNLLNVVRNINVLKALELKYCHYMQNRYSLRWNFKASYNFLEEMSKNLIEQNSPINKGS